MAGPRRDAAPSSAPHAADPAERWMAEALALARAAQARGEVPVGAIVVRDGAIVGRGGNAPIAGNDPTAHAEIAALREAAQALGNYRLPGCELYVTIEPCAMCAAAVALARMKALRFGAEDPKGGGVVHGPRIFSQPTCHHRPDVLSGIGEEESAVLLRDFFASRR